MTGTLLNVSTVIIGSSLGLVLGKYLTEHLTRPSVAYFLPALVVSPALTGGVNWFTT